MFLSKIKRKSVRQVRLETDKTSSQTIATVSENARFTQTLSFIHYCTNVGLRSEHVCLFGPAFPPASSR